MRLWASCCDISNGCATLIIGKGRLVIKSGKSTSHFGAFPGHGVLMGVDEVVVIKGDERNVNIITDGCFHLERGPKQGDEKKGTVSIGACSFLFLIQFLVQLLLVPQGSLFGQIMFLVSLGASWGYNSYLSSLAREKIQTHMLFQALGHPEMLRFRAGTRTTMAVFVCLLLFHGGKSLSPGRDVFRAILHSYLSNDTAVWRRWKEKVVQQLLNIDDESESLPYLEEETWEDGLFCESDRMLLKILLRDAGVAFEEYFRARARLSGHSDDEEFYTRPSQPGSEGFIYFRLEEM